MRKMTDEQLVHYVENRVEKARSEGFNEGKRKAVPVPNGSAVKEFVEKIQDSKIQGVGAVTISKLVKAAREYGYM